MFEDIQKHRQAVRENIEKSFQIGYTENEDFEKAHKVGDIHPNGKWVWTQLPSGKFDWRVIKKQSQSTVPSQQNVNKQQKTEDGLTKEELEELRTLESAARKGYKLLQRDANRLRRLQAKERELKQEKLMAPQSQKTEEKKGKLPEVKFTSSDFKKEKMEREEGDRKDALQLYWYVGPKTEYYDDDGKKKTATPEINEFYSDNRQKHLGGYEIRFDYATPIGSFRTLNEAVSALNDWVNKKRVKNHPKPKWIYNASKGDYQMNYKL